MGNSGFAQVPFPNGLPHAPKTPVTPLFGRSVTSLKGQKGGVTPISVNAQPLCPFALDRISFLVLRDAHSGMHRAVPVPIMFGQSGPRLSLPDLPRAYAH